LFKNSSTGYIGWRNRFLGIDSWAPSKFVNTAAAKSLNPEQSHECGHFIFSSKFYFFAKNSWKKTIINWINLCPHIFFIFKGSVVDPYSIFPDPDPDPEFDVGDQYGSGSKSNTDPGLK
jgi:hypothetical protein